MTQYIWLGEDRFSGIADSMDEALRMLKGLPPATWELFRVGRNGRATRLGLLDYWQLYRRSRRALALARLGCW